MKRVKKEISIILAAYKEAIKKGMDISIPFKDFKKIYDMEKDLFKGKE
ncbi:hypothetical protein [Clostridium neonatale]|nr:hypothetical protein [Clostridium neonatale]